MERFRHGLSRSRRGFVCRLVNASNLDESVVCREGATFDVGEATAGSVGCERRDVALPILLEFR